MHQTNPKAGVVTDALSMCYSISSYDADANTWADECGVGATVTPSGLNSEHGMVSCSNMRFLTMQKFSNLYSNGFSLSFAYYCGSVANYMFALNSAGAANGVPYALPRFFAEQAPNRPSISHEVARYSTHHYVYTYDANTNTYSAYLDGVLIGSVEKTTAWNTNASTYLMFGGWGGHFGDLRVYDRALTADEVAQNYAYDALTWTFDA